MNNRCFFSMWAIMVAFCAIVQPALAQQNADNGAAKPRVSFSVSPGNDVPRAETQRKLTPGLTADETGATIFIRERVLSLFRRDTAFQTGTIFIVRSGSNIDNSLVIDYALEYFDSARNPLPNISSTVLYLPSLLPTGAVSASSIPASLPVAINGLQGDLTPTGTNINGQIVSLNAASSLFPNTTVIQPGQTKVAINFTARWSDQSYTPRSAGLQGRRYARLTILRVAEMTYTVGITLATVMLDDPQNVAPILVNAIQNKQILRNSSDLIELETPGLRSDGLPNAVFYDENFNVLTYTATSSDNSLVTAMAFQSDARLDGRPSLFYAVQPGAQAGAATAITLTANDGTGMLAGSIFNVQVVNPTAVRTEPETMFNLVPNPTADVVYIESRAQQSGQVRVRVLNTLGMEVFIGEQIVSADAMYRYALDMSLLPTGVYMVEVQNGSLRSVRKVIKN
jgi:hypothetical protein